MKKILTLALIFVLFLTHSASAQDYTFTDPYIGSIKASVIGSHATVTFTPQGSTSGGTTTIEICSVLTPGQLCDAASGNILLKEHTLHLDAAPEVFSLNNLVTDSLQTYYIRLADGKIFQIQSGKYQIDILQQADRTVMERTFSVTVPPSDQRDLYLLLNQSSIKQSKQYFSPAKLIGKVDAQGHAQVTQTLPSTYAGQWLYAMIGAKNSDGSYEFLGNEKIAQWGTEQTITAAIPTFISTSDHLQVTGQIDITKHNYPDNFNAFLEYRLATSGGPYPADLSVEPVSNGYWSYNSLDKSATVGINHNGSYYWNFNLSDIVPGNYWFRETFWDKDHTKIIGTPVVGQFNPKKGYIAPGSDTEQADFEARSYRLLAPLPGLSVLLDPDLCQQKQLENPGKGQICNISDFLNYVFKLLIGVSAVVLVLRLIFEGYKYATTDVPFMKIDAKSKIGQAFAGLALALAAWLILNTLNPQLVANQIEVPTVTVNLDDLEGDADFYKTAVSYTGGTSGLAGYSFKTAKFPSGVYCPGQTGGTGDLKTVAQSFLGKVTYNQLSTDKKNTAGYPSRGNPGPNGTFMLDCSSFVTTVLQCAGITPSYNYAQTSVIFNGKEKVTSVEVKNNKGYINGKELKAGDLIGWTVQDNVPRAAGGHVVIYIGDGLIMQAIGGKGRQPGMAVSKPPQPQSLDVLKDQYRWVYRI